MNTLEIKEEEKKKTVSPFECSFVLLLESPCASLGCCATCFAPSGFLTNITRAYMCCCRDDSSCICDRAIDLWDTVFGIYDLP